MSAIEKGAEEGDTDCEILETAVFSPGDLCCHGSKVHGLVDDIAVAGDKLWVYGLGEEGIIVLSGGGSVTCLGVECGGQTLFDLCDELGGDVSERLELEGAGRRRVLAVVESDRLSFLGDFHCGRRRACIWENGKEWNSRTDH